MNRYDETDNLEDLVDFAAMSPPISTDYEPLPSIEDNYQATRRAYSRLVEVSKKLYDQSEMVTNCKYELDIFQAQLRRDKPGKELGVNAEEREGNITLASRHYIEKLNDANRAYNSIKGELEAVQIACRLCDKTLEHIKLSLGSVSLEINDVRS